jgi:pyruvate dehydrogenase (quinone)
MANAMPQALGAQALDLARQVVAFCGDGGLTMLLGDLLTAASHELPVKLVVFDNGRLGMVKLEMEQVGLAEYGTVLHNPHLAGVAESMGLRGIRVTDATDVEKAIADAMAHPGPVLLDVLTNLDEIAIPRSRRSSKAGALPSRRRWNSSKSPSSRPSPRLFQQAFSRPHDEVIGSGGR